MTDAARTIVVAAGQIDARLMNEADLTLESIEQLIASAGTEHADLLVLPECAYPAYLLGSVLSYRSGKHLASGQFLDWLRERAARHRMHVVCGFVEDDGDRLYNSAALIDDRGSVLGVARKRFLWNADRDWFAPGEEVRAFDSRLGRIGVTICAETRVPEILATLVADGARLIAMPTCWINASRKNGSFQNPQVSFLIEARAREFGIPFICADKSGYEMPGVGYVGMSRIVAAGGKLLAEAPPVGDALITARLAPVPVAGPVIIEKYRRRILSEEAAIRPPEAPARKVKVAVFSSLAAERLIGSETDAALLRVLASRGVGLMVAPCGANVLTARVAELARRADIDALCQAADGATTGSQGVRAVFVAGDAIRSFAASRAAALDGAELLIFVDSPADPALLRTRAVENRVFVAAANERMAMVVGPDGAVLAESAGGIAGEAVAEIDLAAAGDKRVAPRTDILAERRVGLYRF